MRTFVTLALLLLAAQEAFSLYGPKSNVVILNKKNFAERVFGSEHTWVVEFFAPWCGHCKNLAPEYEKAATNLKGIVPVAAVDCDVEKELCGNFGVQGFPTIKIFPSKATPTPGKGFDKKPEDYQGQRTASAIVSAALAKLPSFVVSVTSKSEEKFLGNELPKAILFTNKDKTSDLYKALSVDFHNRIVLGEAKHTDAKLVEKYGVDSFPTFLIVGGEGKENIKFDGKLGHEALTKFIEPHAAPAPEKPKTGSGSGSSKKAPAEPEAEPETGEIFEVKDQAAFDEHCANKGGLCALAFLDIENIEPAEYQKYVTVLKSLGEKFKGRLRVMYLNGPSQPELTKSLDLSAFYPTIVALNPRKQRYTPFMGAFSLESISEFFDSVLLGSKRNFALDKLPAVATQPALQYRPPPPPEEETKDEL